MGEEEIQDLAVVGQLLARQYHLVRALLVEPRGKFPSSEVAFGAYSWVDCRDPIQSARGIQIGYGPLAAHAANHPLQDFPEIAIDRLLVEWLQCPNESIDLKLRWGSPLRPMKTRAYSVPDGATR
jgi:hypothetical protein